MKHLRGIKVRINIIQLYQEMLSDTLERERDEKRKLISTQILNIIISRKHSTRSFSLNVNIESNSFSFISKVLFLLPGTIYSIKHAKFNTTEKTAI